MTLWRLRSALKAIAFAPLALGFLAAAWLTINFRRCREVATLLAVVLLATGCNATPDPGCLLPAAELAAAVVVFFVVAVLFIRSRAVRLLEPTAYAASGGTAEQAPEYLAGACSPSTRQARWEA